MPPRESRQGGALLASVSDQMVKLLREMSGRGPTRCKSYWAGDDMLVVHLEGGYSAGEHTIAAAGYPDEVLEGRRALQSTMAERMRQIVTEATGREVVAFMSTSHVDPDMMVEVFVLSAREH